MNLIEDHAAASIVSQKALGILHPTTNSRKFAVEVADAIQ
jgi:hypothetical protein